MKRLGYASGLCAALALAAPAREARASDDAGIIATVLVVVVTVVGTDISFTAYDSGHVIDKKEVDSSWMIAQTILMPPQALIAHVPTVYGQVGKKDDASLFTLFMPVTIWANTLSTFSIWSLGSQAVDVRSRFGVSWLVGTNLTLTTGFVSSFFSEHHYARPWLSIPEIALGGGELIGTSFGAVNDKLHRTEWTALAAWSGTLATHGLISIIAWAADPHRSSSSDSSSHSEPADYPTPFEPLDLPPPPARHTRPEKAPLEVPTVAPTPISNGATVVPGISVLGRF